MTRYFRSDSLFSGKRSGVSRRMPLVFRCLLRACLAALIVAAVMVLSQDLQIFPGLVDGLFSSNLREPGTLPPGVESHFIETADGEKLESWYLPVTGSEYAVVIFHGNAGTVEGFFPYQQWFREIGISSIGFDYRGFGKSSGWPSEEGLYQDGEAAWQFARMTTGLAPEKIILFGISIGTGLAARVARDHQPGILVLLAGYTSLVDVVREMPLLGHLAPLLRYRLPTADYLKELRRTCVVAAHGRLDDTIPFSHLAGIRAAVGGELSFREIVSENAGHNDLFYAEKKRLGSGISGCLALRK